MASLRDHRAVAPAAAPSGPGDADTGLPCVNAELRPMVGSKPSIFASSINNHAVAIDPKIIAIYGPGFDVVSAPVDPAAAFGDEDQVIGS